MRDSLRVSTLHAPDRHLVIDADAEVKASDGVATAVVARDHELGLEVEATVVTKDTFDERMSEEAPAVVGQAGERAFEALTVFEAFLYGQDLGTRGSPVLQSVLCESDFAFGVLESLFPVSRRILRVMCKSGEHVLASQVGTRSVLRAAFGLLCETVAARAQHFGEDPLALASMVERDQGEERVDRSSHDLDHGLPARVGDHDTASTGGTMAAHPLLVFLDASTEGELQPLRASFARWGRVGHEMENPVLRRVRRQKLVPIGVEVNLATREPRTGLEQRAIHFGGPRLFALLIERFIFRADDEIGLEDRYSCRVCGHERQEPSIDLYLEEAERIACGDVTEFTEDGDVRGGSVDLARDHDHGQTVPFDHSDPRSKGASKCLCDDRQPVAEGTQRQNEGGAGEKAGPWVLEGFFHVRPFEGSVAGLCQKDRRNANKIRSFFGARRTGLLNNKRYF